MNKGNVITTVALVIIFFLRRVAIYIGYATLFYDTAAKDFAVVQKDVSELITGRVLVGHALHHDLKVVRGLNSIPEALSYLVFLSNVIQCFLGPATWPPKERHKRHLRI
jgi:hypothetical protein